MSLGAPEIVLIIVAFLLLVGYKKLPDASRSIGRSLRIFKGEMKGLKDDDVRAKDPATTTPVRGEVVAPAGTTPAGTTPAGTIPAGTVPAAGDEAARLAEEARAAEVRAAELRARAEQARAARAAGPAAAPATPEVPR